MAELLNGLAREVDPALPRTLTFGTICRQSLNLLLCFLKGPMVARKMHVEAWDSQVFFWLFRAKG